MENGRCAYHGGRTPKGNDWHKPRWPNGKRPDWDAKLHRKLAKRERDRKERAKRLAAMTPGERAQHEQWQRAHKPGKASERERLRAERRIAVEIHEMLAIAEQRGFSGPATALQIAIDALEQRLRATDRSDDDQDASPIYDIFS